MVSPTSSFGTDAFASLLSEARKFAAHFCLANQYIDQLAPAVRAAVLGNAGTLPVFWISGAMRKCWLPNLIHCRPARVHTSPKGARDEALKALREIEEDFIIGPATSAELDRSHQEALRGDMHELFGRHNV